MRTAHFLVAAITVALGACGGSANGGSRDSGSADAGADAAGADAALTPIRCGTDHCLDPAEEGTGGAYCCVDVSTPRQFCVASNLGQCESGVPYFCTDRVGCGAGHVCCVSSVRALFSCTVGCSGLQLCASTAECLNGQTCVFSTCAGQRIGSCGQIDAQERQRLGCP